MPDDRPAAESGIGAAVRRKEDFRFLTGQGHYTDDINRPGQTHAYLLRSPHAHASLGAIDTAKALAAPGVVAIFTGADLASAGVGGLPCGWLITDKHGKPMVEPAHPVLAQGKVRHVGDPVAVVIAETRDQAKDAAELIEIAYGVLPAAVEATDAVKPGAAQLFDEAPANTCYEWEIGDKAATDAAFAKAKLVAKLDLTNNRLVANPMEPRAAIGEYDSGSGDYTLYTTSQNPHVIRLLMGAFVLHLPEHKLKVVAPDVGGGFGSKIYHYAEEAIVTWAAAKVKRPVKWTSDRSEAFISDAQGRDHVSHAELAMDENGKFLGLRVETVANMGAYLSTFAPAIPTILYATLLAGTYTTPAIHAAVRAVFTNTVPVDAYRGAGRPEATYLLERLVDVAARVAKLDPAEIRRRNLIDPGQMPYTNAMGQTYDSGKFGSILQQGLDLAKWDDFASREAESRARGKLRGRGLASFLEWTGGNVFEERVTVAVSGDGGIEVYASTMPMGQGIATSYAQLVVDVFGVPIEKIRIVMGDTDRGSGFGSAGSRSLFTAGSAINHASERAVATGRELAGDALEAAAVDIEYVEGVFQVAGTDRRIGLFELAARQPDRRIFIDATSKVNGPSWPNGCHISEVEVDPETGVVEIVSYVSANDVGRVVNPMIVRGQLDGGAVQGIGQALGEHMRYDPDSGQAITASFMDYAMPRADIVHGFVHVLDQSTPCLNNPLGVKGVGELGTIGATPAVVNAVADALIRAGRADQADRLQMPLSPDKVWQALQ